MKTARMDRMMGYGLVLLVLSLAVLLVGLALSGDVRAATPAPITAAPTAPASRDAIVRFGEDVVVGPGERVDGVVAFGGDVTVNGTVNDTVVAFGGDVTVNGTVNAAIVAFGGDVRLSSTAVVGTKVSPQDASLVLFGGTLTTAPGAQVTGTTELIDGPHWGQALGWIGERTFVNPWWGFTWAGWLVQTAFFLVLALVAAALMPGQMRAVQRKLAARPGPSLGWGALTFFIIVPVSLVVLVITIIGLLIVIPAGLALLLAYFFVTTAVAAFVAERVLGGTAQKDNLMLAVTLGVVGTTVVSRIPVVGGLALMVMMVMGTGAACLAIVDWRRSRKAAVAPAGGLPPAGPGPAGPGGLPPAGFESPPPVLPAPAGYPATAPAAPVAAETAATAVAPAAATATAVAPAAEAATAEAATAELPAQQIPAAEPAEAPTQQVPAAEPAPRPIAAETAAVVPAEVPSAEAPTTEIATTAEAPTTEIAAPTETATAAPTETATAAPADVSADAQTEAPEEGQAPSTQ